ncbi:hypothetical protein FRC10_005553, partial [Ceratobasidium sp. 414]
ILGIMAFTEAGKMHCDISAYNLLLINPEEHYGKSGWIAAPKIQPSADVWNRVADGTTHVSDGATSTAQTSINQGACPRLKSINKLKRGPVCVVHDTEFTMDEDRTHDKVHRDRTGTPAFISLQLLQGFLSDKGPITRTFMHDVESLFWVLVWVVANRSQDENAWRVNDTAKEIIKSLSQNDLAKLRDYKDLLLHNRRRLVSDIRNLKNDWSENLAPIIRRLAYFLYIYLYCDPKDTLDSSADPEDSDSSEDLDLDEDAQESNDQLDNSLHLTYITEPRSRTFARLLKMFRKNIRVLKHKCPPIDWNQV